MIEFCFTPLSTVFQSYHGDSSHYSRLLWVSPVLYWGFEVSCPRTPLKKKPKKKKKINKSEDSVLLEPRTHRLRVKHFTTEPCRNPLFSKETFTCHVTLAGTCCRYIGPYFADTLGPFLQIH